MFSFQGVSVVGDDWLEGPPVPIPNTEVKLKYADDSCRVTGCENRYRQHFDLLFLVGLFFRTIFHFDFDFLLIYISYCTNFFFICIYNLFFSYLISYVNFLYKNIKYHLIFCQTVCIIKGWSALAVPHNIFAAFCSV